MSKVDAPAEEPKIEASETQHMTLSKKRFIDGIDTVFCGIVQMLGALDVDSAKLIAETGVKAAEDAAAAKKAARDAAKPEKEDLAGPNSQGQAETQGEPDRQNRQEANSGVDSQTQPGNPQKSGKPEKTKEPEEAKGPEEAKKPEKQGGSATAVPGVTLDDLTKIIVGKIEQNPANSGKIRALVGAFGYGKVSEMPSSLYEAFVTELAQI